MRSGCAWWNRAGRVLASVLLVFGFSACSSDYDPGQLWIIGPIPATDLGTTDTLFFDYFIDTLTFSIANSGTRDLSWSASTPAGYLSIDPAFGTLMHGASSTVTVVLDRSGLDTGSHASSIYVSTNAGVNDTIAVRVEHFVEPKLLLSHAIADAEFNRATNRIVAISNDPPALMRIDPETGSVMTMSLPAFPKCVSVSADGAYAAVGHYISVTYVDLNSMSVVDSYPIRDFVDPFDIVLAPGWVYVFPRYDQWVNVRCIELSTGDETPHTGRQVYQGAIGRLDVSGDFLYCVTPGIEKFDKLDVQPGTAAYLYESPYLGQHPVGSNFWTSQDGRLIGATGHVFTTATSLPYDMVHLGQLVGAQARWIDHSSAASRMFAITGGLPPSAIRVYGDELYDYQGTIGLPPFLFPNGFGGGTRVDSEGHYVFCNAGGTRLYTLMRPSGASSSASWALWVTNVPALP